MAVVQGRSVGQCGECAERVEGVCVLTGCKAPAKWPGCKEWQRRPRPLREAAGQGMLFKLSPVALFEAVQLSMTGAVRRQALLDFSRQGGRRRRMRGDLD